MSLRQKYLTWETSLYNTQILASSPNLESNLKHINSTFKILFHKPDFEHIRRPIFWNCKAEPSIDEASRARSRRISFDSDSSMPHKKQKLYGYISKKKRSELEEKLNELKLKTEAV